MKRTHPATPIPVGQFVTEAWRVPIKPPRRPGRTSGASSQRKLLRPSEPQIIVCDFCGNKIKVLLCATPATANRGGRQ